jgi:hypothetical protein
MRKLKENIMDPELTNLIEILITLAAALIAYIQHRKATTATASANAAAATTSQVLSYFDATDETVTSAPPEVPGRSFRMTDSTKRWLTFDHSPIEQECLLRQVAEAEAERLDTYTITVPSAWYDVEYGLIKGSGKTRAT